MSPNQPTTNKHTHMCTHHTSYDHIIMYPGTLFSFRTHTPLVYIIKNYTFYSIQIYSCDGLQCHVHLS